MELFKIFLKNSQKIAAIFSKIDRDVHKSSLKFSPNLNTILPQFVRNLPLHFH